MSKLYVRGRHDVARFERRVERHGGGHHRKCLVLLSDGTVHGKDVFRDHFLGQEKLGYSDTGWRFKERLTYEGAAAGVPFTEAQVLAWAAALVSEGYVQTEGRHIPVPGGANPVTAAKRPEKPPQEGELLAEFVLTENRKETT